MVFNFFILECHYKNDNSGVIYYLIFTRKAYVRIHFWYQLSIDLSS